MFPEQQKPANHPRGDEGSEFRASHEGTSCLGDRPWSCVLSIWQGSQSSSPTPLEVISVAPITVTEKQPRVFPAALAGRSPCTGNRDRWEKRKGPVATSRLGPCPTGAIMLSTRARGPRAVSCVRSACGHREVPSVPVEIDACHGTPFGTTASDATVPNLSRRPCSSPHGLPNAGAPNSLVSVGLGGKAVPHGSHELRHGVVQGKDHGVGARVKRVRHLEPAWSA